MCPLTSTWHPAELSTLAAACSADSWVGLCVAVALSLSGVWVWVWVWVCWCLSGLVSGFVPVWFPGLVVCR